MHLGYIYLCFKTQKSFGIKKNGHQKDIEVGANKLKGRDFSGALLILPMTKVLSK